MEFYIDTNLYFRFCLESFFKLSQSDVLFFVLLVLLSSFLLVVAPCGSNKRADGVQVELLMTSRCRGTPIS